MSCAVLATGDGLDPLHTTMGSGPDLGLHLWELEPTEVGYDGFRMVAVNGLDLCRGRLSWRVGGRITSEKPMQRRAVRVAP